MELDAGQLALIGLVCTVLVYLIRLVMQWAGWKPTLPVIGIISLVVSLAIAAVMLWKDLPPLDLSDPMAFAQTLLTQLTSVLGAATLIYNLVLETLLKKLGLDPATLVYKLKRVPNPSLPG